MTDQDRYKERENERKSEQNAANIKIFKDETYAAKDQLPKRTLTSNTETLADKKSFFNEAGPQGTISADWRCVTDKLSPLVKKDGVVVDLGGSAGRYPEFLALSRKDISQIYAIEPDKEKYDMARTEIKRAGLEGRITLINKPVAEALKELDAKKVNVDAVTSLYRTHIMSDTQNAADMAATGAITKRTGASFLSIDLHRPKLQNTAELMAKVYPADNASHEFRSGYVDGLKSALRGEEMKLLLEKNMGRSNWDHSVMNVIGQLQMHVMSGDNSRKGAPAPNPTYPPMKQEYIDVANDMTMGLKASGAIENASSAVRSISDLATEFGRALDSVVGDPPKTLTSGSTPKKNAAPSSSPNF